MTTKKQVMKILKNEVSLLKYELAEKDRHIEILEFVISNGKHPVQFFINGFTSVGVNKDNLEGYSVKYINAYGDIQTTEIGYFFDPIFDIASNDNTSCIFKVKDPGEKEIWYKLFKDKKLVVDIPRPAEWKTL